MDEDALAYYRKGQEHEKRVRREDNEIAAEAYKKAIELDPNHALAYAGLSRAYSQRATLLGLPRTWLDSAIVTGQRAIDTDPALVDGYRALAMAYQRKGWLQKALEMNQKTVSLDPDNATALEGIGWVYWYSGQPDKALPLMIQRWNTDPAWAWGPFYVANTYFALGDGAKAEEFYAKAVDLQPNLSSGHTGLICALIAQGKHAQAVDQLRRFQTTSPDDDRYWMKIADVEVLLGLDQPAKEHARKGIETAPAVRYNPRGILASTILGYLLGKEGKEQEADGFFQQSLQLDEEDLVEGDEGFDVPYDLAIIHAVQGNKPEAYQWLQRAVDAGWLYYDLGVRDPMLQNLRADEQFQQMMAALKARVNELKKRAEL